MALDKARSTPCTGLRIGHGGKSKTKRKHLGLPSRKPYAGTRESQGAAVPAQKGLGGGVGF